MDPITKHILQEGYILSDKTVSVRLPEFESGKINKLLIVGVAGSGKTTHGEKLAKKYRVPWISIDSMYWRFKQKYFKNKNESKEELQKKVIEFVISALKSNKRFIMEGVDLVDLYTDKPEYRKLILKQAIIILGLSSIRAGIRAGLRNKNREGGEGWKELYWMTQIDMKDYEPKIKQMRKDVASTIK